MKILSLLSRASFCTLLFCGCCRIELPLAAFPTTETSEFPDPRDAPQFSPLDFGYAEISDEDLENVLVYRPMFRPKQQTRQETVTGMQTQTVSKEFTDANGKKRIRVEEVEVPVQLTREISFTIYERDGDHVLRCPIASLSAFDRTGNQLTIDRIRAEFRKCHRVVIQNVGCVGDAFYGGFLNPDTLFLQSNDWNSIDREEEKPIVN